MLRAAHRLWRERNHILLLRVANGIRGLNNIAIQTKVCTRTYYFSWGGFLLTGKRRKESMKEPVEMIRDWLCENLIARGNFDSARLESFRDRE